MSTIMITGKHDEGLETVFKRVLNTPILRGVDLSSIIDIQFIVLDDGELPEHDRAIMIKLV